MTTTASALAWYHSVIQALLVFAMFSPPVLSVFDAIFAALCLPRLCNKRGGLTLWAVVFNSVALGLIFRFVPLV